MAASEPVQSQPAPKSVPAPLSALSPAPLPRLTTLEHTVRPPALWLVSAFPSPLNQLPSGRRELVCELEPARRLRAQIHAPPSPLGGRPPQPATVHLLCTRHEGLGRARPLVCDHARSEPERGACRGDSVRHTRDRRRARRVRGSSSSRTSGRTHAAPHPTSRHNRRNELQPLVWRYVPRHRRASRLFTRRPSRC